MLRGKAGVRDNGSEASQSIVHPEYLALGVGRHQPGIVPDNPRWLNLRSCYRAWRPAKIAFTDACRKHLNGTRVRRETGIEISSFTESHGEHREVSL